MNATWIIPFIVLGGALQSCGAAMGCVSDGGGGGSRMLSRFLESITY